MKKIIMEGPKKSRIVHVDIPKINDSQLLVKVVYTGMCHSEWYPWSVAAPGDSYGHETVGIVADKGRTVKGFQIGDRVTGLGGGGYQEYIVMEPEKAFVVPDAVETIDAIVEPVALAHDERRRTDDVAENRRYQCADLSERAIWGWGWFPCSRRWDTQILLR